MKQKKTNKTPKGFVVAIDGPSGAGKSTVSRMLAEALKGKLMDTGAMYRGVAYYAVREAASTAKQFGDIARRLVFDMAEDSDTMLVDHEDLGSRLRTPAIGQMASQISQFKGVRSVLTRRQRALARRWSRRCPVVVEGRDIGTVVFPDVRFKFFVTADAEVRAERRYRQLKKQGTKGITQKEILRQHVERDRRDSSRQLAPLKCPRDAVVVDTSKMGIAQVVRFMQNHIQSRNFPEG